MTKPQARITDNVLCAMFAPSPAGPVPGTSMIIPPCAPTVLVGNLPAARIGDMHPSGLGPHPNVMGSATVIISNMPASRIGDSTGCGGAILKGEFTVLTGG
ncbi:PAAR domain-containing protein [Sedimentitalea sp. HM32M-2]|uniref:PAAR domain-containing protein n=1 Tax=Sedimentitalea sp. HM32M-2 TaxID=3351566 RepID=UPI00363582D7